MNRVEFEYGEENKKGYIISHTMVHSAGAYLWLLLYLWI